MTFALIHIQSMSDVITNSSSEIFLLQRDDYRNFLVNGSGSSWDSYSTEFTWDQLLRDDHIHVKALLFSAAIGVDYYKEPTNGLSDFEQWQYFCNKYESQLKTILDKHVIIISIPDWATNQLMHDSCITKISY